MFNKSTIKTRTPMKRSLALLIFLASTAFLPILSNTSAGADPISATITFNTGSGSAISPVVTTSGSVISAPANPTLLNSTFAGWYTAASCGTAISFPYTVPAQSSITMYAAWATPTAYGTAQYANVVFDTKGNGWTVDSGLRSIIKIVPNAINPSCASAGPIASTASINSHQNKGLPGDYYVGPNSTSVDYYGPTSASGYPYSQLNPIYIGYALSYPTSVAWLNSTNLLISDSYEDVIWNFNIETGAMTMWSAFPQSISYDVATAAASSGATQFLIGHCPATSGTTVYSPDSAIGVISTCSSRAVVAETTTASTATPLLSRTLTLSNTSCSLIAEGEEILVSGRQVGYVKSCSGGVITLANQITKAFPSGAAVAIYEGQITLVASSTQAITKGELLHFQFLNTTMTANASVSIGYVPQKIVTSKTTASSGSSTTLTVSNCSSIAVVGAIIYDLERYQNVGTISTTTCTGNVDGTISVGTLSANVFSGDRLSIMAYSTSASSFLVSSCGGISASGTVRIATVSIGTVSSCSNGLLTLTGPVSSTVYIGQYIQGTEFSASVGGAISLPVTSCPTQFGTGQFSTGQRGTGIFNQTTGQYVGYATGCLNNTLKIASTRNESGGYSESSINTGDVLLIGKEGNGGPKLTQDYLGNIYAYDGAKIESFDSGDKSLVVLNSGEYETNLGSSYGMCTSVLSLAASPSLGVVFAVCTESDFQPSVVAFTKPQLSSYFASASMVTIGDPFLGGCCNAFHVGADASGNILLTGESQTGTVEFSADQVAAMISNPITPVINGVSTPTPTMTSIPSGSTFNVASCSGIAIGMIIYDADQTYQGGNVGNVQSCVGSTITLKNNPGMSSSLAGGAVGDRLFFSPAPIFISSNGLGEISIDAAGTMYYNSGYGGSLMKFIGLSVPYAPINVSGNGSLTTHSNATTTATLTSASGATVSVASCDGIYTGMILYDTSTFQNFGNISACANNIVTLVSTRTNVITSGDTLVFVTDPEIVVSWLAPSVNGITTYTASAKLPNSQTSSGSCSAVWPVSSCAITGLTAGQTYTISIIATNGAGNSAPSQSANAIPYEYQEISLSAPTSIAYSTSSTSISARSVMADGTPTGLVPTVSSTTPLVCTYSAGQITPVSTGACTIQVTQAGDAVYSPAPTFQATITIGVGAQTLSFTSSRASSGVGTTYSPLASSSINALSPVITVNSGSSSVCTISAGLVTFNVVGTCTLNANQSGNSLYGAAVQVQQNLLVVLNAQTLSFTSSLSAAKVGDTYTPAAASTSSLTPAITVDTGSSSICTISAGIVTFNAIGSCVLNANRTADATYSAGSQVQQLITVSNAPSAPRSPSATAISLGANVSWTAPASTGGSTITGYTVTASPGGTTCSTISLSCSVTGLTAGTSYSFSVIATNASGNSPASVATSSVSALSPPIIYSKPTAPTNVIATLSNGTATVSFTAGSSGNLSTYNQIDMFINGQSVGNVCNVTGATTCSIANLGPDSKYSFTVSAINSKGSATSLLSNEVIYAAATTSTTIPSTTTTTVPTTKALLVKCYFATQSSVLTLKAKKTLDAVVLTISSKHTRSLIFTGFADERGSIAFNIKLSMARNHSVVTYLLAQFAKKKISPPNISQVAGGITKLNSNLALNRNVTITG